MDFILNLLLTFFFMLYYITSRDIESPFTVSKQLEKLLQKTQFNTINLNFTDFTARIQNITPIIIYNKKKTYHTVFKNSIEYTDLTVSFIFNMVGINKKNKDNSYFNFTIENCGCSQTFSQFSLSELNDHSYNYTNITSDNFEMFFTEGNSIDLYREEGINKKAQIAEVMFNTFYNIGDNILIYYPEGDTGYEFNSLLTRIMDYGPVEVPFPNSKGDNAYVTIKHFKIKNVQKITGDNIKFLWGSFELSYKLRGLECTICPIIDYVQMNKNSGYFGEFYSPDYITIEALTISVFKKIQALF